ncbi:MAG: M23 family metallopeptidase, partial [Spirochaetota bacterium]
DTEGKRAYFYYPKSPFNVEERRHFLDNTLRSPVQQKLYITSPFGNRRDPITGRKSYHDGLDIRSPYGAPVYSVANGTVLNLGESKLYGLFVKIRLDTDKDYVALYGHLTAVLVHEGQRINAGEVIGNSGQSGRSTGPHLHLTIFHKGKTIDPGPLLRGLY